MDFGLSEEQRLLAQTLGRYLEVSISPARVREIAASDEGHDAVTWRGAAELGMVRVDREEWRAQSTDGTPIAAGTVVRVADVQGTRVIVAVDNALPEPT